MRPHQITTVTFLKYHAPNKWWIFTRMGRGVKGLDEVPGLNFYKLLGSGAENGFSIKPDFSTYVLLAVWENEEKAMDFFQDHPSFGRLKKKSSRYWTVFMHHIKAQGTWDQVTPFSDFQTYEDGLYAVLTRATIRPVKALQFWKNVPSVSADLKGRPGLLYSKGVGEFPVFIQATLSFWKNRKSMVDYAYQSKAHSEVIKKTRALNWYKEELFANFSPYKVLSDFTHPLTPHFNSAHHF